MSVRALVVCGDCWHPAGTVRCGLTPMEKAGLKFEFCEDGAKWPAEMPEGFSLVVLARANMISATDRRAWLTAGSLAVFQNFLQRGRGLVVLHSGTARYAKLPAMNALMGGAFVSHPEPCAVTMEPLSSHALARGVEPFTVCDEHYFMSLVDARADVFLRSRSRHGVQPAGWTRAEGNGRVCILTPGHNLEVWLHPQFQKLLLNALRWAAKMN